MEQQPSVTTGIPQLDLILGGGIVQNSLMLITGPSGSGKTVLTAQIAFAAAARSEPVLFITAYAEPHNKLLANLRTLNFFNPDDIGVRIKLLNLQHQLSTSIDEAADTIVREAREQRAKLVILDGFQGIRLAGQNPAEVSQFLYDLSAKMGLLGVTTIVTYELMSYAAATPGELSVVDAIVELSQVLHGDQAIRQIWVIKNRGMSPLLGRHSFQLTSDGVICYPRQEAVTMVQEQPLGLERLPFGIPVLDEMLHGGLNRGTTTIIGGAEGVGKTLLSLHYAMNGVANGERTVFFSFHEPIQHLIAKGQAFGYDLRTPMDEGTLVVRHFPPAELNADMVAQELRNLIEQSDVRRLVIDGLNDIERPLIERGRAHGFFASLITFLRSNQITSCITTEIDPVIGQELSFAGKNLSALSGNILLLERLEAGSQLSHQLTILKMRYSKHDRLPHAYTIGDNGFNMAPEPLTGIRQRSRRRK